MGKKLLLIGLLILGSMALGPEVVEAQSCGGTGSTYSYDTFDCVPGETCESGRTTHYQADSCFNYYGYCGYCQATGQRCEDGSHGCEFIAGIASGGGCTGNSIFSQAGCSSGPTITPFPTSPGYTPPPASPTPTNPPSCNCNTVESCGEGACTNSQWGAYTTCNYSWCPQHGLLTCNYDPVRCDQSTPVVCEGTNIPAGNTLQPSQTYQVSCDYNQSLNCIEPKTTAKQVDSPWTSCTWTGGSGDNPTFNCTTRSDPGVFYHQCGTFDTAQAGCNESSDYPACRQQVSIPGPVSCGNMYYAQACFLDDQNIYVRVPNVSGAASVAIAAWDQNVEGCPSPPGGFPDRCDQVWYNATNLGGGLWEFVIPRSNHPNGRVVTIPFAWNYNYTQAEQCGGGTSPDCGQNCQVTVNGNGTPVTSTTDLPINVNFSGKNDMTGSRSVELYMSRRNGAAMSSPPSGSTQVTAANGRVGYRLTSCNSSYGGTCSGGRTLAANSLPVDQYYFWCDAEYGMYPCDGDPWRTCEATDNPAVTSNFLSCNMASYPGTWSSCDNPDNTTPPNDSVSLTMEPPTYDVSGRVWERTDIGNNGCSVLATDSAWNEGAGMSVALNNCGAGQCLGGAVSGGDGTYNITEVPVGLHAATLNRGVFANDWVNICPASGVRSANVVSSNLSNIDYFISQIADPWWQTIYGDMMAMTGAITSQIPGSPNTAQWLSGGNSQTSGVAIAAGAVMTPNATSYPIGQEAGRNFRVANVSSDCTTGTCSFNDTYRRENYQYFYRLFEMPISPAVGDDDFLVSPALEPASAPLNGKPAYWHSGAMTINSAWTVGSTESYVIFVDGNLTLGNLATIDVASGGFVAFIVNGNIIVSPGVGHTTAATTTGLVEGVYIANGTITVQGYGGLTPDEKLVGEGIFIGWGGVAMPRDFKNLNNNSYPVNLFRYRPDLVVNAPDEFRRSVYEWEEVAPITIGGLPTPTSGAPTPASYLNLSAFCPTSVVASFGNLSTPRTIKRCASSSTCIPQTVTQTNNDSYNDFGVSPNTYYRYQVTDGSVSTPIQSITTLSCVSPTPTDSALPEPPSPTPVAPTPTPAAILNTPYNYCSGGISYVQVSWNSFSSGGNYSLTRCANSGCTPSTVVYSGTATTRIDTVTGGIPYGYRVGDGVQQSAIKYISTLACTAGSCPYTCTTTTNCSALGGTIDISKTCTNPSDVCCDATGSKS